MRDEATLPVAEVFGPVWQGEGPYAGRRCHFVRLGLCNLSCEWCDTPYTWDRTRYDLATECPPTTVQQVWEALPPTGLVVLSGGEPMIHARHPALRLMLSDGHDWHVETNGTIPPPLWMQVRVGQWVVSPKVNTRDPAHRRIRPLVLSQYAALDNAVFKFVVRTDADVRVAAGLAAAAGLSPSRLWMMPEGTDEVSLLKTARRVADTVAQVGANMSLRQHVLLYGADRGR